MCVAEAINIFEDEGKVDKKFIEKSKKNLEMIRKKMKKWIYILLILYI